MSEPSGSKSRSCVAITFLTPDDRLYTLTIPRFAPCGVSNLDVNPGQSWSITQKEILEGSACRCTVDGFDKDKTDEPSTVIMKLGLTREARQKHEIEAYCYIHYLKTLQGGVVPRFLGFFKGFVGDKNDKELSCLLLEDCGTCLDDDTFHTHDIKVRLGIALARFHLQTPFNYRHISPEHTLVMPNSERLVLIDFSKLEQHDDCQFKELIMGVPFSEVIDRRLPDPGLDLLGCEEIHEYCTRNRLVVPCTFSYRAMAFTITADIQTEEQLVSKVESEYPSADDALTIRRRCEEAWIRFKLHLDKYSQAPWTKAEGASEDSE